MQSLLVNDVVRNISTLKVVVEEFAHRFQALHLVISDLFLEDSAYDVSSEIRRNRERFRTSVDTKRNYVANNRTKHYVGIDVVLCVCKIRVLFETGRVRSKYEDGRL